MLYGQKVYNHHSYIPVNEYMPPQHMSLSHMRDHKQFSSMEEEVYSHMSVPLQVYSHEYQPMHRPRYMGGLIYSNILGAGYGTKHHGDYIRG